MSTSGIVAEEIDKQAALVSAALENIAGVGADTSARQLLPQAVLALLRPYSAALFVAERVVQSDSFNAELVQALHSKLLPLERMADNPLDEARRRGYYDDPDTAQPLHWLETCNDQIKDCMVALESMLDPHLDDLMAAAMEEHQRGETVPLELDALSDPLRRFT